MSDKAESAAQAGNAAGGASSKLVVALTGLNSVLLVGVIALVLLRGGVGIGAKAGAEAAEASHDGAKGEAGQATDAVGGGESGATPRGPGPMLQLPDFVVHLRDPDADRYARLTLNVELQSENDKELVNGRLPQIRDAFLAYLSDRTVEELRGSEGMGLVKQDLAKKLNELVPAAPVKALYVTDIVVQ